MPVTNILGDIKLNNGGAMYEPAPFPGCLDPDLAVGPGRFHQKRHGGLHHDSTDDTVRISCPPGVLAGQPSGNRSLVETVCGLA